eukprot:tig00000681_g3118.t1
MMSPAVITPLDLTFTGSEDGAGATIRFQCPFPVVTQAHYGSSSRYIDLTKAIQDRMTDPAVGWQGESLSPWVSGAYGGHTSSWSAVAGDPAWGEGKTIRIKYSCASACVDQTGQDPRRVTQGWCLEQMPRICSEGVNITDPRCARWSNMYLKTGVTQFPSSYALLNAKIDTHCKSNPTKPECACWKFQQDLYNSAYGQDANGGIIPASCIQVAAPAAGAPHDEVEGADVRHRAAEGVAPGRDGGEGPS